MNEKTNLCEEELTRKLNVWWEGKLIATINLWDTPEQKYASVYPWFKAAATKALEELINQKTSEVSNGD